MATADLLKACKQAGIIAREGGNVIQLRLTPGADQTGKVTVLAESGDTGESEVELPATVTGPEMTIAFNVKFLQDGLEAIRTKNVVIETNSHKTPAVIRPAGEEEYLYHFDADARGREVNNWGSKLLPQLTYHFRQIRICKLWSRVCTFGCLTAKRLSLLW